MTPALARSSAAISSDSIESSGAQDRFHLGSNAKAMTATLAAVAVERGLLEWTSDAAEVLAGNARGATLERLLSHTAGIRPLTDDAELVGLPGDRLEVARMLLSDEPLGEGEYSNGGYTIVSAMLESVFDTDFESAMTTELFEPLDLDAGFGWPDTIVGHYCRDGALVPHDRSDGYVIPRAITAAGDVRATIDSYARFVQLHLRGLRGDAELLRAETFAKLHTPIVDNFALGWGVQEWEGARTSVHTGSAETFFAVVVLQAERDFAAVALVNAAGEAIEREAIETVRELARA